MLNSADRQYLWGNTPLLVTEIDRYFIAVHGPDLWSFFITQIKESAASIDQAIRKGRYIRQQTESAVSA
jgi:hypothetical protein